jgi:hypothetical protein
MKKYKNKLINYVDKNHIFYEKVQKPENYLNIIKDKIINLHKQEYKNIDDIITNLNNTFKTEKIIFLKYSHELKYSSGISSAGYNPKTNYIYLFYTNQIGKAFKIKNEEYDSEYFNLFIENLHDFLGHEIIHRMQFLKDKKKEIGIMSTENRIKYLSKPKDVMAHAWEIVQEFKLYNKSDLEIRMLLKSKRDEYNLKWLMFSPRLKTYYTSFDINSKTMKLLYKYIYEYTEEY